MTTREPSQGKWIVHTKGAPDSTSFEIAIIRENNRHGLRSYGWFGEDKIAIAFSPNQWSVTPEIWAGLLVLAANIADKMNRDEEAAQGG